jgi:hypothetical protein
MDPGVTLGVLCDQVIPPEDPVDEEEQQIRDHLRSLVIAFLKNEAVAIIRQHTKTPGTNAENVLVGQLLTVSRCSPQASLKVNSCELGHQKARNTRC